MKASELITEVQRQFGNAIDDDDLDILALINRGRIEIAGGGDRQHGMALVAPLPGLFTRETVTYTAGSFFVAMPTTFQRELVRVTWGTNKLKRYPSFNRFIDCYENEAGKPEAWCLRGKDLWIGPEPSEDLTLTIYYYRLPVALTMAPLDTTPDEIPDHLQSRLLVSYACREIYKVLEAGLDMQNPDTAKHDLEFQRALTDLERLIGPADGEPENVADEYYTEDNIL